MNFCLFSQHIFNWGNRGFSKKINTQKKQTGKKTFIFQILVKFTWDPYKIILNIIIMKKKRKTEKKRNDKKERNRLEYRFESLYASIY